MASRASEFWRPLRVALTLLIAVLMSFVSSVAHSAPAPAADPCASVTPGPPPPPGAKPPVASFTAPAVAQVGQAVAFDGSGSHSASATVTSWCWTFGDGAYANGAEVSHTYAAAGQEAVALTVTDSYGLFSRAFSAIKVTAVTVVTPPVGFRLVLKEKAHDAASRLRSGERVRLYGSVVPARQGRVAIERARAGGGFSRVHVGKLHSRHGLASFSMTVAIVHSGSYRARVLGTAIVSRRVRLRLRAGRPRAGS